jgi:FkbM family methyltransferase
MTPGHRIGEADRFRSGSWLERTVDRWRRGRVTAAPPILRRAYEGLLDRLPGDHLVSQMPGGERVRLSARYRHLSWNPVEYTAFRAVVRPGATVLDVGANVGAYTLMFAAWVGDEGRVFAFEPAPEALAGLRTHVALNGFSSRVDIVEAAVSSSAGRAPFAVHRSGGASSLSVNAVDHPLMLSVPTETIDGFCAARGIQPEVIKIDVEGAELDVLIGARRTLARAGVEAFVEMHPSVWAVSGVTRAAIEGELHAQGFVAEPLDPAFDVWTTEGVCVRLRPADK